MLNKTRILSELTKEELVTELKKRGNFEIIEDHKYTVHNNILLREVQNSLAHQCLEVHSEIKEDKAIIFLETQCGGDEENLKLPLVQVPYNTENIEEIQYWPIWKQVGKFTAGTPCDIWRRRCDNYNWITNFDQLEAELKERGFIFTYIIENQWKVLRVVCPRCASAYPFVLIEKGIPKDKTALKEAKKELEIHECYCRKKSQH